MKRRHFLKAAPVFTLPLLIKGFPVEAMTQSPLLQLLGQQTLMNGRVLVLVQLNGGNDGLNTVIPISNDIYYRERPRLGITKDKALGITGDVGLNPALEAFKSLYDDGSLGILNSVGYPNPDRSHFRSMDIWHSASASNGCCGGAGYAYGAGSAGNGGNPANTSGTRDPCGGNYGSECTAAYSDADSQDSDECCPCKHSC